MSFSSGIRCGNHGKTGKEKEKTNNQGRRRKMTDIKKKETLSVVDLRSREKKKWEKCCIKDGEEEARPKREEKEDCSRAGGP